MHNEQESRKPTDAEKRNGRQNGEEHGEHAFQKRGEYQSAGKNRGIPTKLHRRREHIDHTSFVFFSGTAERSVAEDEPRRASRREERERLQ